MHAGQFSFLLKQTHCQFIRHCQQQQQLWFCPRTQIKFLLPDSNKTIPIGILHQLLKAVGIQSIRF